MATLNIAEFYGLDDRGAIAPGRRADLVVCSDLENFRAERVLVGGQVVADDGSPTGTWPEPQPDVSGVAGAVVVDPDAVDLRIDDPGSSVRVIGLVPGQIVTEHRVE